MRREILIMNSMHSWLSMYMFIEETEDNNNVFFLSSQFRSYHECHPHGFFLVNIMYINT